MFVALAIHYSWHFPIPVPNSSLIRTTALVEKDVSTSVIRISVDTSSRVFDHSLLSIEQVVSDLSSLDLPLAAHPSNRKNKTKQHTLPEHSGSSDRRADLSYSSSSTRQNAYQHCVSFSQPAYHYPFVPSPSIHPSTREPKSIQSPSFLQGSHLMPKAKLSSCVSKQSS